MPTESNFKKGVFMWFALRLQYPVLVFELLGGFYWIKIAVTYFFIQLLNRDWCWVSIPNIPHLSQRMMTVCVLYVRYKWGYCELAATVMNERRSETTKCALGDCVYFIRAPTQCQWWLYGPADSVGCFNRRKTNNNTWLSNAYVFICPVVHDHRWPNLTKTTCIDC